MEAPTYISEVEMQVPPCIPCIEDERGICFKHKLRTLQWGSVPGGARSSSTNFDRQALESQIGNLDANAEYTRESTEGYGPLKWDKGEPYYRDRNTGDFNRATASDMDRILYGSQRSKETRRSFSVGGGPEAS